MKKILHLSLLIFAILIFTRTSYALYLDQESSVGNKLTASTLYFYLIDGNESKIENPFFNVSSMQPGLTFSKSLDIEKRGEEDFKYKIYFGKIVGDDDFCKALYLQVKKNGTEEYLDSLYDFSLSPILIDGSGMDHWEFNLTLNNNDDKYKNNQCSFYLTYEAWQTDMENPGGFRDEFKLENHVLSGTWDATPGVETLQLNTENQEEATSSSELTPTPSISPTPAPEEPIHEPSTEPTPVSEPVVE